MLAKTGNAFDLRQGSFDNIFAPSPRKISKKHRALGSDFWQISSVVHGLISLKRQALAFVKRVARLPFLSINLRTDMKSDPMTTANSSDSLIEEFLKSVCPEPGGLREAYLARQTMYSLMRLVKAEQLLDIRHSVNRLVPASLQPKPIKRPRGKRASTTGQHKLVFGKQD